MSTTVCSVLQGVIGSIGDPGPAGPPGPPVSTCHDPLSGFIRATFVFQSL